MPLIAHTTPTHRVPTTRRVDTVSPRRQAGRRPRFSADDVVGTALRLGLGTFSVAAVARELGVTTAAVYRRFPSHRDLLEECLSRILAEVRPLTEEVSWQDALRRGAAEWWALCLKYPELPQVVSRFDDQVGQFVIKPFRSYGQRLIEDGFTERQAYFVASLVLNAISFVFSLPEDSGSGPTREFMRTRAVEIIVKGIDKGNVGWQVLNDGSAGR